MARFGVMIFTLALLLSSADGWAYDENNKFLTYATKHASITWMPVQGLRWRTTAP